MTTTVKLFVAAGLCVGLALAVFVSPFASEAPDGLETVAEDEGFADAATEHRLGDGPLADYAVDGDDSGRSTAAAGAVGVLVTFGLGLAAFAALRLLRPADGEEAGGDERIDPDETDEQDDGARHEHVG